jgi:nucleotide-binding universal stress UspA family protein
MSAANTRILVPLDGSELAEHALSIAIRLARLNGAAIELMRVVPPTGQIASAERYLDDVVQHVGEHGVPVFAHAEMGTPADQILAEAATGRIGSIVMSTHGRGGLGRLVNGSVADVVVHASPVPVLLVPGRCASRAGLVGDTIVVPVDGSAFAELALTRAAELARELTLPLSIVYAVWWNPTPRGGLAPTFGELDRLTSAMRRYVDDLVAQVRRFGVDAHGDVSIGPPARLITDYATLRRAALIVMSSHGRTGVDRLAAGSVATDVLMAAPCPLLLLRPQGSTTGASVVLAEAARAR